MPDEMEFSSTTLLIVVLAAALAPIIADLPRRLALQVVVLEIVLGIIIGPQVLDIARPDDLITVLSTFGLAALFFMAGAEIDFAAIKGRPTAIAGVGWLASMALALVVAAVLTRVDVIEDGPVVAVALTTTTLGVLAPVLKDAGILGSGLGALTQAAGAMGELAPIVVVSIFFAASGSLMGGVLLTAFTLATVVAAAIITRVDAARVTRLIAETMHASGQLAVRLCMLVLVALVVLANELGLDIILGAFAAGLIVNLTGFNGPTMEPLRVKIQGIAFGFFVPIFFIHTGMVFALDSLLDDPVALLELPLFLVLFLAVRGIPTALLARRDLPRRDSAPLALFSATALPMVVAITEIGVTTGDMSRDTAASMVGAGMLSVLIFPLLALALRSRGPTAGASSAATGDGAP